jgi:hypothetical protein
MNSWEPRARMAAIVPRLSVGRPDVAGPMPMVGDVKPDSAGISTLESGAGRPPERCGIILDYGVCTRKKQ